MKRWSGGVCWLAFFRYFFPECFGRLNRAVHGIERKESKKRLVPVLANEIGRFLAQSQWQQFAVWSVFQVSDCYKVRSSHREGVPR